MNPAPTEGIFDANTGELVLFIGGGVVTVMVLALGIWLFVRASREEHAQVERDLREAEKKKACAEGRDPAAGGGA